jgi:sphinganine-1-phosphate aldolase
MGWDLNVLQFPPAMHLCVTMVHTMPGFVDKFLADLSKAVAHVLAHPSDKVI